MDIELTRKKINELLNECREAAKTPGAYGLLPYIITILESIQNKLKPPGFITKIKFKILRIIKGGSGGYNLDFKSIVKDATALGLVVTDNYHFTESPLGSKLLAFASEIISKYNSNLDYPAE
jgi:hypothetical protein